MIWPTNSVIEARLLFNFCTFGAVLYLRFCQFLLNKSPNFPDFFGLLFEIVFYSKQSSITELTVLQTKNVNCVWSSKAQKSKPLRFSEHLVCRFKFLPISLYFCSILKPRETHIKMAGSHTMKIPENDNQTGQFPIKKNVI